VDPRGRAEGDGFGEGPDEDEGEGEGEGTEPMDVEDSGPPVELGPVEAERSRP